MDQKFEPENNSIESRLLDQSKPLDTIFHANPVEVDALSISNPNEFVLYTGYIHSDVKIVRIKISRLDSEYLPQVYAELKDGIWSPVDCTKFSELVKV